MLEFETKSGGVSFWGSVRVSALIQSFSKDLLCQGDPSTNQNPGNSPKLGIGLPLSAHGAGPPVTHSNKAPLAVGREQRGRGADSGVASLGGIFEVTMAEFLRALLDFIRGQEFNQVWELEVLSFPFQSSSFWKVIRQDHLPVPEIVQNITEQEPISVDEKPSLGVLGEIGSLVSLQGKHSPQAGMRDAY